MKTRLLFSFSALLLCLINAFTQVTVTGYAYLENQSNHANTKVRFVPKSPAAILDSTYTDALGYYEHSVNEGMYTIQYEKAGYQSFLCFEDVSIIEDFDAGTGTLFNYSTRITSDTVAGIWNGDYTILNNIEIQQGDSLIIDASSNIRFEGDFTLTVNGYLEVNGSDASPVLFISMPADQVYTGGQWTGILLNSTADDNCRISYAEICYAREGIRLIDAVVNANNIHSHHNSSYGVYSTGAASRLYLDNYEGNNNSYDGLFMDNGIVTVSHADCHHNGRYGAYFNVTTGTVTNIICSNNSNCGSYMYDCNYFTVDSAQYLNNDSYGVRVYSADWLTIKNSKSIGNASYGFYFDYYNHNITIENSISHANNAAGILLNYDNTNFKIRGNRSSYNNGVGIQNSSYYSSGTIEKNVLSNNKNDGIHFSNNHTRSWTIRNNTIYGNAGDGIEINNGTTTTFNISNNIIVGNSLGIRTNTTVDLLEHNSFYENTSGTFSNVDNTPVNTWKFLTQNINGDSADIYLNLYVEPSFNLKDSLDFTLQKTSKNINAGIKSILDPDGSVSDIGALYYDKGNPQQVGAIGYTDQMVVLAWEKSVYDSIVSYNVYYKPNSASTYTLWANVTDTTTAINGLTNGVLYDFTVTGVYPAYESVYAPEVSEMPGDPAIVFDPVAYNVTFASAIDTLIDTLRISNPGTKDLTVDFEEYMQYGSGSAALDGNGDYISVSDNSSLDGMQELTIELWYNNERTGNFDLVCKHYYSYTFYIQNNNLGFVKTSGGGFSNWTSSAQVSSGWHHLAVTWKENLTILYIDGIEVARRTDSPTTPIMDRGEDLRFGSGRYYGSYANGNITEVRIWDVARTLEEIQSRKSWSLKGNEEGLVGYWPLAVDALDYSQNSNNGTLQGDTYFQENETFDRLLLIDNPSLTIKPGGTAEIAIKFPNISSGTQVFTTPVATNIYASPEIDYEFTVTYDSNVVSTPVHFTSVPATGLPYTMVITNAKIDGATLNVGDEIAVFDGNLCVGAGVFDGSFNYVVTAWKGDLGNNLAGFTTGNPISFKIFDTSADLEATTQATFDIGNGTFGYGQFSTAELSSSIYTIQPVSLTGGRFNLISFNLLPRYNAAETVFAGQTNIEIVYNDKGGAYIPEYNINSLGDIEFRDGYNLFTKADTSIYFYGTPVNPSEWNIALEAGRWNSIAYISQDSSLITSAFPAYLHDSIAIVQTSSSGVWIPSQGVNTIGYMKAGLGYQVATTSDINFTFSYDLLKSGEAAIQKSNTHTEYFSYIKTGLPYTVILDVSALNNLKPGDEIAVFDGSTCVGAVVYEGGKEVIVPTWESYSENGIDLAGFLAGNEIDVLVRKTESKEIVSLTLEEKDTFKSGYYSVLKAESMSSGTKEFDAGAISVFPNPFSEKVTISIPDVKQVASITIINVVGEVIAHLPVANTIEWSASNNASGVYYVNIATENSVFSTRIVLVK